jgi:ATP-dependent helicase/nuclease subunit B
MAPRVFTIPASAPFLPTLIGALIGGRLGFAPAADPLALSAATLFLPTRRACRLARDAFLDVLKDDAAILPRIVPIGDIDEDEIAFAEAAAGELASEALALPQALGGLERRLLLTQLVAKWASSPQLLAESGSPLIAQTPSAAYALAGDLAGLIDDMTMRGAPWDRLDDLVPDEFDRYWELTLRFLQIAREAWPNMLNDRNCIELTVRRDRLLKAEATRLARKTDAPVIVAGSTGSIPATAELIATIARLPHGAVVLPGLDIDLDEESWRLIAGDTAKGIAPAPGHPQFAMKALLARIGIGRDAVASLATPSGRERLMSEALRPAAATDLWPQRAAGAAFNAAADGALETISVIEAANAEEESLAIAVALREAIEQDKTVALVTRDADLGSRVLAALARWKIAAEDSRGQPLHITPAGIFARLAADVAIGRLAPVTLLALLKHPLLRLGGNQQSRAVAALERAVLRGPRPRAGSAGLAHALKTFRGELEKFHREEKTDLHPSDPRTTLRDDDLAAAANLIAGLAEALEPLESIAGQSHRLGDIVIAHQKVVAGLSRQAGDEIGFAGLDGAKLAALCDELTTSPAAADLLVDTSDYVELFTAIIADTTVRDTPGFKMPVRILGALEARLTESDRVVLGGLVEGKWPGKHQNDAWLSRPMRAKLGLDLPERWIGLAAHDFAQLVGAKEVILSHAAKIAGSPTVPSRFIQRLAAVAGNDRWNAARSRGEVYLAWARALDRPEKITPAPQPAPRPPRAARPKGLSVTDIENWLRDPYTIYAKHVLRLVPLAAVDVSPGAAERGTIIHAAIGDFTKLHAGALPDDPVRELLALGRPHFAALEDFPETRAFWWPRFERIARWFADWERKRRPSIADIRAETRGAIDIVLADGVFKLRGIADRVEQLADGRFVILDYKTGSARTEKQVRTGLAPQLTLEAAMLRRGGFAGVAAGASIAGIAYVLLKGGARPGEGKPIDFTEGTPDSQAERALQKLTALATRFDSDTEPYRSLVHPMWTTHYGEYDHLARVKEWSATGGENDDAAIAAMFGSGQ